MGEIIRMSAAARTDQSGAFEQLNRSSRRRGSTDAGARAKGQIILLDATSKDRLLLQYRRRKFDERNVVIYKGSTTLKVPGNHEDVEVRAGVFVKNRSVDYYFYSPEFGNKICGNIHCRVDFSTD
jgi:hypothetical protein